MSPKAITALSIAAFWLLAGLGCAAIHHLARRAQPPAPPLPKRPDPIDRLRQAINDLEQCEAIWTASTRKENRP
ncbi:hypothetical protein ACLIYM_25420 [Streptomyces fenghuangensis]